MPQQDTQAIDPTIQSLAATIGQLESGTSSPEAYTKKGLSGEYGRYQMLPDKQKALFKQYLGDANAAPTIENQNKAMYGYIKDQKAAGHNPAEIMSMWNAGDTHPDAYKQDWRGTNAQGVAFDTPSYVQKGSQIYQQKKQQQGLPPSQDAPQQDGTEGMSIGQKFLQEATGAVKGGGQFLVDMSRQGSDIANQTAGRVVNAVGGGGFNPLPQEGMGNTLENPTSEASQGMSALLASKNKYQGMGNTAGYIGASLLGPGEPGATIPRILENNRIIRAPIDALKIASEAITSGNSKKALMSLSENPIIKKDADAILPLVKKGILKAKTTAQQTEKNTEALKGEITNTAKSLISRLRNMDVQPTVDPEDLGAIFKKTIETIKDTPRIDEKVATQEATKTWNKFLSFLPKGKPTTAEDILVARQMTDKWVEASKGTGVFDPSRDTGFTTGLRAMRQGANELVADKAPDQGVKDALAHQTSLYNVLENVAEKGKSAVTKAKKDAEEIQNLGKVKGLIAEHPYIAGVAGTALSGVASGLGISEGGNIYNFVKGLIPPPSNQ